MGDGLRRPVNPDLPADSGSRPVVIPRSEVRSIRRGIVVVLGLVLLAGVPLAVGQLSQDETNDHLAETDEVVVEFLEAEFAEEDREQAAACVDAHQRYEQFEALARALTAAGANTAAAAYVNLAEAPPETLAAAEAEIARLLPAEIAPLLESYPPPGCDAEAAAELLATPAPTPPDVSGLVDR